MEEQKTENSLGLKLNKGLYWVTKNWLVTVLVPLAIFVSLPFAAPTLMRLGYTNAANAIYWLYKPFCHQFGFRSFYLFGEQTVYPRDNTGTDLVTYEEIVSQTAADSFDHIANLYAQSNASRADLQSWAELQWTARAHVGNEIMGYKLTVCERDIAIYLSLFLGGVLYGIFRRRIRPVPLWVWFFLGLGPIGIDGFSQLLSYPPFELWDVRETLPVFRVLTGATFGFMNAWLGFPYLQMSFDETRRELEDKFRRANIAF